MPLVLEQINDLSMADKMQVMKYLVAAIERGIVDAEKAASHKRCLTPDPLLRCEIKCDLFEDTSADWEIATSPDMALKRSGSVFSNRPLPSTLFNLKPKFGS